MTRDLTAHRRSRLPRVGDLRRPYASLSRRAGADLSRPAEGHGPRVDHRDGAHLRELFDDELDDSAAVLGPLDDV
ncbi:hypothetical protein [Mycobacterium haemophilum]|uniref:hypothetical protein n=1 Tax=Mycobacterium haemophilum TaxID=29311 RepID=UPI0006566A6A|nr:hypothetical protein [Mycobacterium haemophilum]MCV7341590.1 hypothetical protein [Mycobacterium haemophilum DSM 44634]